MIKQIIKFLAAVIGGVLLLIALSGLPLIHTGSDAVLMVVLASIGALLFWGGWPSKTPAKINEKKMVQNYSNTSNTLTPKVTNIKISARIIRFPPICCCCSQQPDTHIDISFTRRTGKRVIKRESKSWPFPICSQCQKHIQLYNQAKKAYSEAQNYNIGGIGCIILGILTAVLLIGILFLIYGICARCYWGPAALRNAKKLEEEAKAYLTNSCTCQHNVVRYHGWYGTVHSFDFQNESYAHAFIALNQEKVLGC
jgi:hypothetical protein